MGRSGERQPLTSRQRQVYDAIKGYAERTGVTPTYAALAEIIGVRALSTVHDLIYTLRTKGWIESNGRSGRTQAIRLIEENGAVS
jgi:SOS-response transcriptional repressor LexA